MLFSFCDEGITRTKNFIALRNAIRAVSERRDRLGAPHFINFGDPAELSGIEDPRINPARFIGWGAERADAAASKLGRNPKH